MDQFIFRQVAGLELLVSPILEASGFINAFTTRRGGVSPLPAAALNLGNFSQDDHPNIIENRRRLNAALQLNDRPLLTLQQIHSADIHWVVNEQDVAAVAATPPVGDALIAVPGVTLLAVQTADCLPILIADRRTGATAVVHAGWRGTLAGIVSRTVRAMRERLASRPEDLLAAIGPAIGPCCFEVGPEVLARFREVWSHTPELVSNPQPDGRVHLDLSLANRLQLHDAGLPADSIQDCRLCTICHNNMFFSYRAEKGAENPVGRLMGVIGWRGNNDH